MSLNSDAQLRADVFEMKDQKATREGFGVGVVTAGENDTNVVVITADLSESTKADGFQKKFPKRFFNVGVAEQNLATVGSGMAAAGKIPFITSYAAFNPGRNWEQIRTTIALNDQPVKVCGMHAGLMTGPDGATHQALEDIATMRVIPNMMVVSPCDMEEARKATIALATSGKPAYLRCGREKWPSMTTDKTPFQLGKAEIFWKSEKSQVAIFSTGPITFNALQACQMLEAEGIGATLVNIHTIKPIDREAIVREAKSAGCVVSVEEHNVIGGLGSAIAEVLAKEAPTPQEFLGTQDVFGQSGEAKELYEFYGLGPKHIVEIAKKAIARK